MKEMLHFHPEVAEALEAGRPVVALESTLITHGLPWPDNAKTALAMEAAVRDAMARLTAASDFLAFFGKAEAGELAPAA